VQVPVLDLKRQYESIRDELRTAIDGVLAAQHFILGPEVAALENEVAQYCERRCGVGVASGTDALALAVRASGIGSGDEVLVPSFSFIATADCVSLLGATPVFVDICPDTFCMDPASLAKRITPRARAIIPVHLYGQAADMDEILEIARQHQLAVIEDNAQSIGARYFGRRTGSMGDMGCLSFFPSKNLGAYGDGGAVMTPSAEVAERVGMLRNHGQAATYDHVEIGWNSRLDSIQAVVLTAKLAHLDAWNDERRQAAARYGELLGGLADVELPTPSGPGSVWHLYVVQVPDRDRLLAYLRGRGIGAAVHYPVPIHLMPAWAGLGWHRGDFPNAERRAGRILSLPLFPGITPAQQERVVDELARGMASS